MSEQTSTALEQTTAAPGGEAPHAAPDATIVVTTRNRKDELGRTLESCLSQRGNIEVLVIDDASDDGTSAYVRERFPRIRLERNEVSRGLIAARNQAAGLARGRIIFSIDDDAVFTSEDTVERVLREFDHPRVGAVAMPHIHVTDSPDVGTRAPDDRRIYACSSYVGTAHALRRDLFLALGGYHAEFVRQGEETDLCLRLMNAGYIIRLGLTPPIHHFPSKVRNLKRQYYFAARNSLLHVWINVPMPLMPLHAARTTLAWFGGAVRLRSPGSILKGLAAGYAMMLRHARLRRPVRQRVYIAALRMARSAATPLDDVLRVLPDPLPLSNGRAQR